MDETQYYADAPPTTVALTIKPHFEALTDEHKLYAHHISRSVNLSSLFHLPSSLDVHLGII